MVVGELLEIVPDLVSRRSERLEAVGVRPFHRCRVGKIVMDLLWVPGKIRHVSRAFVTDDRTRSNECPENS